MTSATYSVDYMDQMGDFPRHLRASVRQHVNNPDGFGYSWLIEANMTLPTRLSADEILYEAWRTTRDRERFDNNRSITVVTPHPVTAAQCWELRTAETKSDTIIKYIQKDGVSTGNLLELGKYAEQVTDLGQASNSSYANYKKLTYPPAWTASPEDGSHSIIGIMFSMEWRESNSTTKSPSLIGALMEDDFDGDIDVAVCTLSAHWNTGEVQWIDTAGITLIQTTSLSVSDPQDAQPIDFDLSDLSVINSTDFSREMDGANALYLAGSLAVALGEVPQTNYYNGTSTNLTDFSEFFETNNMTTLRYTNTLYGYGYGVRTTSSYLSLAVMSVYCVITILYLGYSFSTGLTSTAWSSAVELVALALQSSKPSILGDSSVGIDSVKTFSQSVGIRVNTDNELELVFANERDSSTRTLRKIERNKEY